MEAMQEKGILQTFLKAMEEKKAEAAARPVPDKEKGPKEATL